METTILDAGLVQDLQRAHRNGRPIADTIAKLGRASLAGIMEYGCLRWTHPDAFPPLPRAVTESSLGRSLTEVRSELGLRQTGRQNSPPRDTDPREVEFYVVADEVDLVENRYFEEYLVRFEFSAKRIGRDSLPAPLGVLLGQGVAATGSGKRGPHEAEHRLQHPDASAPGDLAMIITPEQATLKAQQRFESLLDLVRRASQDGQRIDLVERDRIRSLLALGFDLLTAFVAHHGDGDQGPEVETTDGHRVRRLPESHDRRYVSVFGELTISRVVHGTREGQRIERTPLDERLGLPEGDFSYVLEDWSPRLCLKESFAEAGRSLEMLLGLKLGARTLEPMSRAVAGYAPAFRDALSRPPPEEEGPLLVVTADGKGVPLRRPPQDGPKPHHRRTKGEKANKKQRAGVGAVDTIEPFVRSADDILDEVLRDERAGGRPEPQHKHVWAEMTRQVGGETVHAKDSLFALMESEAAARNSGHDRPVICLLDGERALWEMQRESFAEAVGILNLFHVLERLWAVAHCFHTEGSDGAKQYVEERLRDLLQGQVGYVIAGLRRRLNGGKRSGSKRKVVESAVEYLANNRDHMRYDAYLAAGYPIGSGVAEGACRHLVKDRMEQTGMRWTVEGAQAMLHVRAVYLNDQWGEYLEYRIEQEQTRLYGSVAA